MDIQLESVQKVPWECRLHHIQSPFHERISVMLRQLKLAFNKRIFGEPAPILWPEVLG